MNVKGWDPGCLDWLARHAQHRHPYLQKNLHTWTLTKFQSHTVTFEVTRLYRPLCTTLILHKKSFQIQVYVHVCTIHSQYTYVWDTSSHHYNTNTRMYMSCVRWQHNAVVCRYQACIASYMQAIETSPLHYKLAPHKNRLQHNPIHSAAHARLFTSGWDRYHTECHSIGVNSEHGSCQ